MRRGRRERRAAWRNVVGLLILGAVLAVMALRTWVYEPVRVVETSMEPTLHPGDMLLLNRHTIRRRLPERGTLVVLQHPLLDDWVVKRVVAVENDRVRYDQRGLWVNGKLADEPYAVRYRGKELVTETVPAGHVYVLGDNRPSSEDSRDYHSVPREALIGEVARVLWRGRDAD